MNAIMSFFHSSINEIPDTDEPDSGFIYCFVSFFLESILMFGGNRQHSLS